MKDDKLSFSRFFQIVWKRLWVVIIFTFAAVVTSWYVSYQVVEPTYESKVDILIAGQQTKNSPILTNHIDDSLKLVTTYQDILISPYILKDAQKRLSNEGHSIDFDRKDISTSNMQDSQVVQLKVKHSNPTEAAMIANAIAASFDQKIQHIMNLDDKNAKVLNKGTVSNKPVFPQPLLIIGITFVLALIISMWLIFVIHRFRDKE